MQTTITSENIPIKLWLDDMEEGALQQARNLANLPFAFHHIAIMPDAHFGYGMPIGGILATRDEVIPNAVGVDIGCGMCAVKTSLEFLDRSELKQVMKSIRATIPLGFKHHKKPLPHAFMPEMNDALPAQRTIIYEREYEKARKQVGTLGGGNHFIEIQQGGEGHIWFMIHSGSRNLGYQVAQHYNKLANNLNKKHHSPVPTSWQLAHLSLNSDEGQMYLHEMNYCVQFAYANRIAMCKRVEEALIENVTSEITFSEPINIAHNYAAPETHYGTNVCVHRKGATKAEPDDIGIIPGSQGSASYIVRGKGNPESFSSCSHGAGRKLGRKQAQRTLNLEQEKKILDEKGIIHALRGKKDLEEAASAYKNIDEVLARQNDLVEIIEVLQPLAVIKG
ncbi:MAG: RtcB family protein [Deltaproteobacteria bacterium]|nr:RtcB family protein [Deltaproteobacteria bacterium]